MAFLYLFLRFLYHVLLFLDSDASTDSKNSKNTEEKKRGRKRKADRAAWKKEVAKKRRNLGQGYVSVKSKKLVKEREIGPACNEKCRLKCFSKFSETDRKSLFNSYWKIGDVQGQRDFLRRMMEKVEPKYRYIREGSNRQNNCAFYVYVSEEKKRVCKTFLTRTLSISNKVLRTVISKTSDSGIVEPDGRGKHTKHAHINENIMARVRAHIQSIPRMESHYCRATTTRQYIDGSKSIADLHRDYTKEEEEAGRPFVSYQVYRNVFNFEFNLAFFSPKKDQCEDCTAYTLAEGTEKEDRKEAYEKHILEKDLARKETRTPPA